MSEQQRNRRGRGIDLSNVPNPFAPMLRIKQQLDEIALRALQENIDNARSPQRQNHNPKGTKFTNTYTNTTAGVETQIKNSPGFPKGVERDVAFRDTGATGYDQRAARGSSYDRRLRSAVVQDQVARGLGPQAPGDKITANPTTASRARLYQQMGGDALAAKPDRQGDLMIRTTTNKDGTMTNARGAAVKAFDPNQLKGSLAQMAVKNLVSLVGGPYVQGAMQLNSVVEGMTGKNIGQHHIEGVSSMREAGAKHLQQQQQQRDPFDPSKLDKYLDGVFANPAPWDTTNPSGLDRLF